MSIVAALMPNALDARAISVARYLGDWKSIELAPQKYPRAWSRRVEDERHTVPTKIGYCVAAVGREERLHAGGRFTLTSRELGVAVEGSPELERTLDVVFGDQSCLGLRSSVWFMVL